MNEQDPSTPVSDDVILDNILQDETAVSALAGRLADISVILDVLVEAIDNRDKVIDDLLQRVSDLEQTAQCAVP